MATRGQVAATQFEGPSSRETSGLAEHCRLIKTVTTLIALPSWPGLASGYYVVPCELPAGAHARRISR